MTIYDDAMELHRKHRGKIEVVSKVPVVTRQDLSTAYTPGVAEPCRVIEKKPEEIYDLTSRWNLVAVVSDGTAVLGLGDIGAEASLPVMEGKAVLFKVFGGVDAFPICINTKEPDEIVDTVCRISPTFGGINLEDISAPRCFEIERKLKERLDIPIFHDDQHGTGVVVLSGVLNSLKVVGKKLPELKVVLNGAGAAGVAVSKILLDAGVKDLTLCDRRGTIYKGREGLNWMKEEMAEITNPHDIQGDLTDALDGADLFIGVSAAGILKPEMVKRMKEPIIFAMANPTPEIMPDEAKKAGARIVCTGRSDFPNQVNNVLGFPGIFRGALDVRASDINEEMKVAAAYALSGLVEPTPESVIPDPLDKRVVPALAKAVAKAAMDSGVARLKRSPEEIEENARKMVG